MTLLLNSSLKAQPISKDIHLKPNWQPNKKSKKTAPNVMKRRSLGVINFLVK